MGATKIQKGLMLVNSLWFVLVIIVGGALFLAWPHEEISMSEKRKLASAPVFSFDAFFSGKFADQSEAFYNDNFIFRENWLAVADIIKSARGWKDADAIQLVKDKGSAGATPPLGDGRELNVSPAIPVDEEYQRVSALIVSKGRAIQIFGGSKGMVKPFADLVNDYQRVLGPQTKIYAMSIPSGSDYFLPREVTGGKLRERENIHEFYSMLDPAIVRVAAYEAIAPHTAEYVWFRTDHHWTGLGAYYAYRAFAKSAGFEPLALNRLTHKVLPGSFLGSLYYRTRSPSLAANRDTLHYYMVPNKTSSRIIRSGIEGGVPASLYFEKTGGGNSYGVFLGGDHPLMRVETGIKNSRKILVIKDSYGNAFVPYLAAHYQEVWIVDYRYFKGTVPELMKRHGIKELLYAHNSFATNSAGTVHYGRKMLGQ